MKRAIILAGIFCGVAAVPAWADHHEGHESKSKMVLKADSDGNGEVTKAEFQMHADQKFNKMDKDGDGTLSAAEIKACDMEHKDADYKDKDGDDRNVIQERTDVDREQKGDNTDAEAGPNLGGTEHNQTGGAPAGNNQRGNPDRQ